MKMEKDNSSVQKETTKEVTKDGKLFVIICDSHKVKEGKGLRIAFDEDVDMQVAVFRIKNKLYCVSNICPHRHATRIYEGIVKDLKVTCPLHGWTYSIETGENVDKTQGIKNLIKYDIFETDGKVFIEKPVLSIPKWREDFKISSDNPVFE